MSAVVVVAVVVVESKLGTCSLDVGLKYDETAWLIIGAVTPVFKNNSLYWKLYDDVYGVTSTAFKVISSVIMPLVVMSCNTTVVPLNVPQFNVCVEVL